MGMTNRTTHIPEDFEVLFRLSPAAMLVHQRETEQVLAMNQAALDLFGLKHDAALQRSLSDLRYPADSAASYTAFDQSSQDFFSDAVWRIRHQDDATPYVQCTVRDMEFLGQPACLTVLRDVTTERHAIRAMETSERRFRDLFEHTPGYICTHDLNGVTLSINPAATAALGYSVDELLGTSLQDLVPESLQDNFPAYLQRLRDNGSDRGLLVLRHRDGSLRTWQYHNRLFVDGEGDTSVMASAQDITEMRAAEEAARRSERKVRTIADALPLRVAYISTDLRFEFVNGLYERLYGRHRNQIVGKRLDEILDTQTFAARLPYLQRALNGQRQQFEVERNDSRDVCHDEITFLPEFAADGHTVQGIYVMAQDVTNKKEEEQRLVQLAQMDGLTGLLNRSGLMERLRRAVDRSQDQRSTLALMYMDLDSFKQVNDVHGHGVGDWVLQVVAKRLKKTVRVSDALARLGGDEFVLIMEGVPDSTPVTAMAQHIVEVMMQPFVQAGNNEPTPIRISVSIGVALHDAPREGAAALLNRADEALYRAKRDGRGTWRTAERFADANDFAEPDPT